MLKNKRQSPKDRESRAGRDDYKAGLKCYDNGEYNEAEKLLREAAQGQEKILGRDHKDTLHSKHWLGLALYKQRRYSEAEEPLREAAKGWEKILGRDHEDTLYSKHNLGLILYEQRRYSEAEEQLREAAQGCEEILGRDHEDTLYNKFVLGKTLYLQQRYSEAEELFDEVLPKMRKVLGHHHAYTVQVARLLEGLRLESASASLPTQQLTRRSSPSDQRDRSPRKSLLRHTPLLAENDELEDEQPDLLPSSDSPPEEELHHPFSWPKQPLLEQRQTRIEEDEQKKAAAEERAHNDAETTKMRDEDKLAKLEKLILAQKDEHMKRKAAKKPAPKAKRAKADARTAKEATGKQAVAEAAEHFANPVLPNQPAVQSPLSPTSVITSQVAAGRLDSFFQSPRESRSSYTDSEILQISTLLKHSNPPGSKVPRTYIVLRTIGYLKHLHDFLDAGFSDYWFPVTARDLPAHLSPSLRTAFVDAQSLVLTKSMDLEKGEEGQHCYFKKDELPPFETQEILGNGGYGQVDKVLSQISFMNYARKRVPRSSFRGRRKEDVKLAIAEIEILKRLKHHHIVEFVGSYTDARYIGLIMTPVADMDLAAYLKHIDSSRHNELRTFFGCLATALEFLHEQKVRHKDIKPGNVLVHRGTVLFTDFGLSFDFNDANGSTTVSMANGKTPRYCAPEVASHEPRNTKSDIWSLGVVFLEMISVLKGRTVQYMNDFLEQHGTQRPFIYDNFDGLSALVAELEVIGELYDNRALAWTRTMLEADPRLRPTASSLVATIIAASGEGHGTGFCGICCLASEEDEEYSDWSDG